MIVTKTLAEEIITAYQTKYREYKSLKSYAVKTAVSMSEFEFEMSQELANKYGITFSEYIRVCIFYFTQSIKNNG